MATTQIQNCREHFGLHHVKHPEGCQAVLVKFAVKGLRSLTDSSTAGAIDEELLAWQGALPVVTFFSISPTSSKCELPAANVGR